MTDLLDRLSAAVHPMWPDRRMFAVSVGDLRRLLAMARDAGRLRVALTLIAKSENDTPGTRAAARYALTGSLEGVVDEMRRAALEGTALAEPKQGSGPPGKGPYDPDRIGARVAALEGTDR